MTTKKGEINDLKRSVDEQIGGLQDTAKKLCALGDHRASRKAEDLLKLTEKLREWQNR